MKREDMYLRSSMLLMLVSNLILLFMCVSTFNEVESLSKRVYAYELAQENKMENLETTSQIIEPEILEIEEEPIVVETDPKEIINAHVREITKMYKNVNPELVMSIIYHESRYNPKATNGNCPELMQVSTRWHSDRASKLGVTDFYDPYSNILLGVDYLSELFDRHKDPALVLMLHNMKHDTAFKLYNEGKISSYASSVLSRANEKSSEGVDGVD